MESGQSPKTTDLEANFNQENGSKDFEIDGENEENLDYRDTDELNESFQINSIHVFDH